MDKTIRETWNVYIVSYPFLGEELDVSIINTFNKKTPHDEKQDTLE